MNAAFTLAAGAVPVGVAVIAAVYLIQYRTKRKYLISPLIAAHFLAVTAIIASYGWLILRQFRGGWWQYPGWAAFVIGSVLFWYAVRSHPACLVPDQQRGLVRVGPYKLVRHPIYAGGLLGALGLIGVAPSWHVLVVWLELAVCLTGLTWIEERELCKRVGAAYRAYRRDTRLLVPGVL